MKKNSLFVCLFVCVRSEVKRTSKVTSHRKCFYRVFKHGELEFQVDESVDPIGEGQVTPSPVRGQKNIISCFFTENVSVGFSSRENSKFRLMRVSTHLDGGGIVRNSDQAVKLTERKMRG